MTVVIPFITGLLASDLPDSYYMGDSRRWGGEIFTKVALKNGDRRNFYQTWFRRLATNPTACRKTPASDCGW